MKSLEYSTFIETLKLTKYGQKYLELVNSIQNENRGKRLYGDGYEYHHIHPKSLGGEKRNEDLLLKVSLYEHYLLHYYLYEAIPCSETAWALQSLTSNRISKQFLSSSEEEKLQQLQKFANDRCKNHLRVSEETRKHISEVQKGREPWNKGKHLSEEHRQKVSKALTGLKKPPRTKEHAEKLANALRGRKQSTETIEKRRRSSIGKSHVFSEESRNSQREKLKKRVCIQKEGEKSRMVLPSTYETKYKSLGWIVRI